jgi:hypothetical protein
MHAAVAPLPSLTSELRSERRYSKGGTRYDSPPQLMHKRDGRDRSYAMGTTLSGYGSY